MFHSGTYLTSDNMLSVIVLTENAGAPIVMKVIEAGYDTDERTTAQIIFVGNHCVTLHTDPWLYPFKSSHIMMNSRLHRHAQTCTDTFQFCSEDAQDIHIDMKLFKVFINHLYVR